MTTKSSLIADYIFHPLNIDALYSLVNEYGYKAVTVLFDCDAKIAYDRVMTRNNDRHPGIAIQNISYETFEKGTQLNREFRFGSKVIHVNTNYFENVSYEDITKQILDRRAEHD